MTETQQLLIFAKSLAYEAGEVMRGREGFRGGAGLRGGRLGARRDGGDGAKGERERGRGGARGVMGSSCHSISLGGSSSNRPGL